MLTRELITNLLELQKRNDSLFSRLPTELINIAKNYDEDPSSDISKALKHAAYATKMDVDALLTMLEANPALLLQRGNVVTPGGNTLVGVTIYECLLGGGDYELAERIQPFFTKFEEGAEARAHQYERYQPFIEGMLKQKPYDISPLVELIKKASPGEIKAFLDNDFTADTELCRAMIQFHKDWAPKILREPCMHYNYNSLQHAFRVLEHEWENLIKASDNNFFKCNAVWLLLAGFEMRRLPGIDRWAMAESLTNVVNRNMDCIRSCDFTRNYHKVASTFPVTDCDDSLDGVGINFSIGQFGVALETTDWVNMSRSTYCENFGKYISNKNCKLEELIPPQLSQQREWCAIA